MRHVNCLLLAVLTIAACRPTTTTTTGETAKSPGAAIAVADLVPNQKTVGNDLISGGQPSADQLEAARDAGYKTVINMRTPGEKGEIDNEAELVASLGMNYASLPINGSAGLTRENTESFARLLETVEYPALVHCGSGNRIGAMFALKAFYLDGKSADEALDIGRASGLTRLEGAVKELLEAEAGVVEAAQEDEAA